MEASDPNTRRTKHREDRSGMMDFGSFQDRTMLEKFMEATLNVNFGSHDPAYAKRFRAINDALQEIRNQYNLAHEGEAEVRLPFFNCGS